MRYVISHRSKYLLAFCSQTQFCPSIKMGCLKQQTNLQCFMYSHLHVLDAGINTSRSRAQSEETHCETWKLTWPIYRLLHWMSLFVLNRFAVAPVVSLTSPRAVGKAITTPKRRSWLDI